MEFPTVPDLLTYFIITISLPFSVNVLNHIDF